MDFQSQAHDGFGQVGLDPFSLRVRLKFICPSFNPSLLQKQCEVLKRRFFMWGA
jgi:hypothetical protein